MKKVPVKGKSLPGSRDSISDFVAAGALLGSTRIGRNGASVPNVEARLAAILLLERVAAREAEGYYLALATLCAYVRLNATWDDEHPPERAAKDIPADIQMALRVLVRTEPPRFAKKPFQIDLSRTDLRGAVLWGGNLRGAILARANLEKADLGQADLSEAALMGSNLSGAILWRANLEEAQIWGANLQRASLAEANLTNANLSHANLRGAALTSATVHGAQWTGVCLDGARLENIRGFSPPSEPAAKTRFQPKPKRQPKSFA